MGENPQRHYHDRDAIFKCESQAAADYMKEAGHLKEMDLRPKSFKSLAEAFHASLCVIRCLRGMLYLHTEHEHIGLMRQQAGDSESAGTPHTERLSVDADVLAHQASFIADDAAYAELLEQPSTFSQALGGAPAEVAPEDRMPAPEENGNSLMQEAAAHSTPEKRAAAAVSADESTKIKAMLPSPDSPGASGASSSASQIPGGTEYELSVCKALLLLQQLAPNSTPLVGESPPLQPPQAVPALHGACRSAQYLPCNARPKTSKLTRVYEGKVTVLSAAILEILLSVRLLQGTQQLMRADFARLLHQQQKQQQQLLKTVQTTVMKLGVSRIDFSIASKHLCCCFLPALGLV